MAQPTYQPKYGTSHALIIGIDEYPDSPLQRCVNDAEAVASCLRDRFQFNEVQLILNGDATRDRIREAYLSYAADTIQPDDRLIVFFAGHGHTRTSIRGETGFLIPVDGDPDKVASLVPWSDFTAHAELISAKHIFFVMDACYGGLAASRFLAGRSRFARDMLQRLSRQVLTAGKGDQPVLDGGGPRPSHSIFTGHFLNALEGNGATPQGIITAATVSSYVYQRVAAEPLANQTPHQCQFDGDGDFIFNPDALPPLGSNEETENDTLIQVPVYGSIDEPPEPITKLDHVKRMLSDPTMKIELDELVTREIKQVLASTEMPVHRAQEQQSDDTLKAAIPERLKKYEVAMQDLMAIAALIARWGNDQQLPLLRKISQRLGEYEPAGGLTMWVGLRCYPVMLATYSAGIAALVGDNYDAIRISLLADTTQSRYSRDLTVASLLVREIKDIMRGPDTFKCLPAHERHYAPRSEYLHKQLQPLIEDLFFVGNSYEKLFDRYEILFSLTHVDIAIQRDDLVSWAPFGRFAWKYYADARSDNPYSALLLEAESAGDRWAPLQAGMFGGSLKRFLDAWTSYEKRIQQLGWH